MTERDELCVVCSGPLDDYNQTSCQMCGGRFHLPWSVEAQIPQCGRIASHDEALALVFLCHSCYETIQEG